MKYSVEMMQSDVRKKVYKKFMKNKREANEGRSEAGMNGSGPWNHDKEGIRGTAGPRPAEKGRAGMMGQKAAGALLSEWPLPPQLSAMRPRRPSGRPAGQLSDPSGRQPSGPARQ